MRISKLIYLYAYKLKLILSLFHIQKLFIFSILMFLIFLRVKKVLCSKSSENITENKFFVWKTIKTFIQKE